MKNAVPDALGRRSYHMPALHQMSLTNPKFRSRLTAAYQEDPWASEIIETLSNPDFEPTSKKVAASAQLHLRRDNTTLGWYVL